MIRRDNLDVLFDLTGHTSDHRLHVFGRRAAPVQISWAGYVGTTGLDTMDYVLGDRFHIPPGSEADYVEKILRMPDCYVSYEPPAGICDVGELPAVQNGFLTFGSFCNPSKVYSFVLEKWSHYLSRFSKSRLLLCYRDWPDPTNRERILLELKSRNLDDRVDFSSETGAVAAMARYNEVDVALDTFPYSGGLTTAEALYMGVPTITWPGRTFAGRHSLSHLTSAGLEHPWVVAEGETLNEELIALLSDFKRLSEIRKKLASDRSRIAARHQKFASDFQCLVKSAVDHSK